MKLPNEYQLRKWLAREIHNRKLPRKPPQSERRGPARDSDYRAWIRTLPSVVSGKSPCEACHTGSDGGMSMKASDYSCLPLTPEEHREYHRIGRDAFARRFRLDYARLVARLNAAWRGAA